MAAIDVSPYWVKNNRTRTVTFIGTGTAWLSAAPTFTPSNLAGVSAGSVTVVSNLIATVPVTYGTETGVVTWTDSTTSSTVVQRSSVSGRPMFIPTRR